MLYYGGSSLYSLKVFLKSHVYGIKNGDGATRRRIGMWNPQAMRARGSMAAALHIPFQTDSKSLSEKPSMKT
jgi:hypothetical protein